MLQKLKLRPNQMLTEIGLEKKCQRCGEWWPDDPEFYGPILGFRGKRLRDTWCKACRTEYQKERRK